MNVPAYRLSEQAATTPGGGVAASVMERWTPPLYQEDASKGVLGQRRGASLTLSAGHLESPAEQLPTTALVVGKGAVISVDPGQSINLRSIGQLTVDGTLNAWGGSVNLNGLTTRAFEPANAVGHGRSIWLGENALIDVAARAATAVDNRGSQYGLVRDGGKISIGGEINLSTGTVTASDLFVVVREGARLDASGTQAVLDVPGQGATRVASNGGSISLASNNGLYLDGSLVARAGGAGAAGGSLNVALDSPYYTKSRPGPATWKLLYRMSRPAETMEMSVGLLWMNRLPVDCSLTAPGAVLKRLPLLTMSRPAIIQTGPLPSYQVCPECKNVGEELNVRVRPLLTPTRSPVKA